jgi:hypothetical protein
LISPPEGKTFSFTAFGKRDLTRIMELEREEEKGD